MTKPRIAAKLKWHQKSHSLLDAQKKEPPYNQKQKEMPMASWMKRALNKLLGRESVDEVATAKKKEKPITYSRGGAPAPTQTYPQSDWMMNPANPASPLSPLNPAFNDASSSTGSTDHHRPSCDPTPSHHSSSSGHCAPDTSSYQHTTSHDTSSSYTHHDTSSSYSHSSFDSGSSFSHHH